MLVTNSHPWTLRQRWFIATAVALATVAFSAAVYSYERYYRGPDDSFFVGNWGGDYEPAAGVGFVGDPTMEFHFRADHTFEGGKWWGAGEFLYLRWRLDLGGDPLDRLEMWHIDSMAPDQVRLSQFGAHVTLKRDK